MSQSIRDFVTPSCGLLALGEPTHQEPAFGWIRNELFVQLLDLGFRSIALEIDRVAALAVNDFVQQGIGSLDAVLSGSFSHRFGEQEPNRALVTWMRDYNRNRPPAARVSFHGFDAPTENTNAPSPRGYLEFACDYLKLDLDIASLAGDDEQWERTEAIMDPAMSPGATAAAQELRLIAEDMRVSLHARAAELSEATSAAEWQRAATYLAAGIGLLRYHEQSAQPLEQSARIAGLLAARDVIMAENLMDIRAVETERGATLVFAHNLHLRRGPSSLRMVDVDIDWNCAGAIVGPLLGEQYTFIAGSLGRSDALGLQAPAADTYEALFESRTDTWGLTPTGDLSSAHPRTDTARAHGYFPLDHATVAAADAVLHISDGAAISQRSAGITSRSNSSIPEVS